MEDERKHLLELIDEFDVAMFVTCTGDGRLRARPMALADRDEGDPHLYFATSLDSPKVRELEQNSHVNVVMQSKSRFVSISGRAEVIRDRALVDRLWSEAWRVWFPGGKEDPHLCLVRVDADEAEYWDQSGGKGLRYLLKAAAAYVSRQTPERSREENAKVPLG